jgi:hypothetical protein
LSALRLQDRQPNNDSEFQSDKDMTEGIDQTSDEELLETQRNQVNFIQKIEGQM